MSKTGQDTAKVTILLGLSIRAVDWQSRGWRFESHRFESRSLL